MASRARRLASRSTRNLFVEQLRAAYKLGDQGSVLGALWSLLSPIFLLVVLYAIFKSRFGKEVEVYSVYLLIGITTVGFFVNATGNTLQAFSSNKLSFLNSTMPKEAFIAPSIIVHAQKYLVELTLCALLAAVHGAFSWAFLLLVAPLLVGLLALVIGVGLCLALLYTYVRDTEHLWRVASRILFFVTPIFYTLDQLSGWAGQLIYWFNPLTPFLVSLRGALLSTETFDPAVFAHALALGALSLSIGYVAFLRFESAAMERI